MSWSKKLSRDRERNKESEVLAGVVTMADVDAFGSVALDLEAAGLFLDLTHYIEHGDRREDHIAILLEAATGALRNARATFDAARKTLGDRLHKARR